MTAIDPAPGAVPEAVGVHRVRRPFEADDVMGAWLVVAATGDEAVNEAVASAAERAGAWVTRADRPDGGGLAFAATMERGPVQIGVSTAGLSPSLARWIRDRIDAAIPPAVETMVQILAEVPRRDGRRGHRGLDFGGALAAIEAGDVDRARQLLDVAPEP